MQVRRVFHCPIDRGSAPRAGDPTPVLVACVVRQCVRRLRHRWPERTNSMYKASSVSIDGTETREGGRPLQLRQLGCSIFERALAQRLASVRSIKKWGISRCGLLFGPPWPSILRDVFGHVVAMPCRRDDEWVTGCLRECQFRASLEASGQSTGSRLCFIGRSSLIGGKNCSRSGPSVRSVRLTKCALRQASMLTMQGARLLNVSASASRLILRRNAILSD